MLVVPGQSPRDKCPAKYDHDEKDKSSVRDERTGSPWLKDPIVIENNHDGLVTERRSTCRAAGARVRVEAAAPALGPLTRVVRSLPSATMIVTNAPDDAYLATGRPLLIAPLRHVFVTERTNHAFHREMSDLAAILRDRRGVLLLRSRALVDEATAADFSRYVTLVDMGHYRDWGLYRVLG